MVKKEILILNKFERVSLFTARANELESGLDLPKIDSTKEGIDASLSRSFYKVAEMEFEQGLLDLEIYRKKAADFKSK